MKSSNNSCKSDDTVHIHKTKMLTSQLPDPLHRIIAILTLSPTALLSSVILTSTNGLVKRSIRCTEMTKSKKIITTHIDYT